MAAKELRVVQDSKFTGIFTREQIERAIRRVEGDPANGRVARREPRAGSRAPKSGTTAKH